MTSPRIRKARATGVLLLFTALLAAGCQAGSGRSLANYSPGDWPSYGLDSENSLHSLDERILTAENASGLQERWRIEGLGGVTGTPAVVDGTVYFGDWHGWLHAVDAETGEAIWEQQLTEDRISASALVTDELVIAGDLAGVLYARDRGTGEAVWSLQLESVDGVSIWASPIQIGDLLVIGVGQEANNPSFRGSLVGLDARTGDERWRVYTTSADESAGPGVSVWSSAAVDLERKMLYVGTGNTEAPPDSQLANAVLAVRYETGEIVWVHRFLESDEGQDLDVGASPNLFAVDGREVVAVGGKSGEYRVLDRDTGELVWSVTLTSASPRGGVIATAAIDDGVIYVGSNSAQDPYGSTTFALDARSGAIRWQHSFPDITIGAPALANGVLYQTTAGTRAGESKLFALDATDGSELWSVELGGAAGGGISISNGMLFVGYGFGFPPFLQPVQSAGLIAFALP